MHVAAKSRPVPDSSANGDLLGSMIFVSPTAFTAFRYPASLCVVMAISATEKYTARRTLRAAMWRERSPTRSGPPSSADAALQPASHVLR
jgi:hypothetical protein